MFFLNREILIGPGGWRGDVLAAIWFAIIILAFFIIPRHVRIRIAERLGLGIRPRPGEPGLPTSSKVRTLISAFILIFVVVLFLFWVVR